MLFYQAKFDLKFFDKLLVQDEIFDISCKIENGERGYLEAYKEKLKKAKGNPTRKTVI